MGILKNWTYAVFIRDRGKKKIEKGWTLRIKKDIPGKVPTKRNLVKLY